MGQSGLHYVFGEDTSARTGNDVTTLFAPGVNGCAYTYSWGLNRIVDANGGNQIAISYRALQGLALPVSITYGGNPAAGLPDLFKIGFVYENAPRINVSTANGGFLARSDTALHGISVCSAQVQNGAHICGGTNMYLLRSYVLSYNYQDSSDLTGSPPVIFGGNQLILTAVTLYNGNIEALANVSGQPASTLFDYLQHTPANGQFGFAAWNASPQPLEPVLTKTFAEYDALLGWPGRSERGSHARSRNSRCDGSWTASFCHRQVGGGGRGRLGKVAAPGSAKLTVIGSVAESDARSGSRRASPSTSLSTA